MIDLDLHMEYLQQVCRSFTRSLPQSLEDLVHTAWIHTRLLTTEQQIKRAAKNLMIDLYRHKRLQREYEKSFLEARPKQTQELLELEINELMARVQLNPIEKQLIYFRFYKGLKWKNIELLLGFSRQYGNDVLTRALGKLKDVGKETQL